MALNTGILASSPAGQPPAPQELPGDPAVHVWTDEHVRAHVAACFLAFALESYLGRQLGETVTIRPPNRVEELPSTPAVQWYAPHAGACGAC